MTALLDHSEAIWQLAFWAPDRNLVSTPRKARAPRIVIVTPADVARTNFVYACTYPGCSRGPENPFREELSLTSHRFAAHAIRSTNADSIARQQRRDRQRAARKGAPAPEYIDAEVIRAKVRELFPINLPRETRDGGLDLGDREHVRRRLCYLITRELQRELHRAPAEIAIVIAQVAASGCAPLGLSAKSVDPDDALAAGPRPSFTLPKRSKG